MGLGAAAARVKRLVGEARRSPEIVGGRGWCRVRQVGQACFAVLGLAVLAGCQSGPPVRAATSAATAEEAEARFLAALTGDIAALEPLLADDFLYATSEGTVLDRSALLDHLRSGATKVDRVVAEEVRKLRHEGLVVTTGYLVVDVRHRDKALRVRSRYVHVWIETEAGWQLLVRESDVPPPRPP